MREPTGVVRADHSAEKRNSSEATACLSLTIVCRSRSSDPVAVSCGGRESERTGLKTRRYTDWTAAWQDAAILPTWVPAMLDPYKKGWRIR
jgi:hypothetical protein